MAKNQLTPIGCWQLCIQRNRNKCSIGSTDFSLQNCRFRQYCC